MFKPKKEEPATKNKAIMPVESGMPKSAVIRKQLDEATAKRGCNVEQAWTTSKPNQKFVLMCQWDKGAEKPVWTLYEENSQESKMHFSQPFDPNDFAMMYDVICMSAPDAGSSVSIPDALKPPVQESRRSEPASYPGASSTYGGPSPMAPSPSPYAGGGSPYPPAPTATPYPGYQQPQQPQQQQPQGYPAPPAAPYPPGYPQAPPQQPQYNQAPQQPQYNAPPQQPQYNQPPQQPQYNAPTQQPQYNAPPQQQPYNPMNSPPPWQQQQQQQGYGGAPQAPAAPPVNPYSQQMPSAPSAADKSGLQPVDYNFMQKKSHILLGTLLFESGLISEPTLEAALKIQEFVKEERMSPAQACDVLKRHHNMGGSIDQYLNPADFDGKAPEAKPQAPQAPARPGAMPPDKLKLQQAAIDLLQKSGIVKEEDLRTAHAVRSKHGGDMVAILQAAGKLEAVTYKAAETCVPLIKDGLMKFEQCIIALNYCSRSRVDFDAALDGLGWENPRKAPK